MKHVKGNLRPPPATAAPMLPSARIRCDVGRIRVGDHTFVSASDALSAYMQQFDGKQTSPPRPNGPNGPRPARAQDASPVRHSRRPNPANVTGLLTGSPDDSTVVNGDALNGLSPASVARRLNLDVPTRSAPLSNQNHSNSKLSVSFALPDSTSDSRHYSDSRLNSSLEDWRRDVLGSASGDSAGSSKLHSYTHSTRPSSYLTAASESLKPSWTEPSGNNPSPWLSQSKPLIPNGLAGSDELGINGQNGWSDKGQGLSNGVDPPRVGLGGPRAKSEVEVLLTAMPSQTELQTLTQDTLREVKLKRLLKDTASALPPQASGNDLPAKFSTDAGRVHPSLPPTTNFQTPGTDLPKFSSLNNVNPPHSSANANRFLPPSSSNGLTSQPTKDSFLPQLLTNGLSEQPATNGLLPQSSADDIPAQSSDDASNKSCLQQEVEEALNRSAQLLETIKTDVLVSPRCVSDVGSLNTDVLLSVNPYSSADAIQAATARHSRSRHRYSYHTPAHHARSLSVGRASSTGGCQQRSLRDAGRRRSVDSLQPSSSAALLDRQGFLDLSSSASMMSDSEDVLRPRHRHASDTGPAGPPSWVQELMPQALAKDLSNNNTTVDSVFLRRELLSGRRAPSWVNGLESDAASSVDTQELRQAADSLAVAGHIAKRLAGLTGGTKRSDDDDGSSTDLSSYAGPGLTYSDLMTGPSPGKPKVSFSDQQPRTTGAKPRSKVSRNHSFSGVGSGGGGVARGRKDADRSKPPVSHRTRICQDLAGADVTTPTLHRSSPNLSSSVGAEGSGSALRQQRAGEGGVVARRALDRYMLPLCSSFNSANGPDLPLTAASGISVASPISRDSNFSNKLCLDDPTLTPAKVREVVGVVSPEDGVQDLLDGDRPWEASLPSFKPPVQVGSENDNAVLKAMGRPETPTLSGGQQPGSMEALKQMLFRLQDEETASRPVSTTPALTPSQSEQDAAELIPALKDYDFEVEPGGQSLERALVHLGRLKTLVQSGIGPPSTS